MNFDWIRVESKREHWMNKIKPNKETEKKKIGEYLSDHGVEKTFQS